MRNLGRPIGIALAVASLGLPARADVEFCAHVLGTFGGASSECTDISDADPPVAVGQADIPNGRHRGFSYSDYGALVPLTPQLHVLQRGEALSQCADPWRCNTSITAINRHGRAAVVGTIPDVHVAAAHPPLSPLLSEPDSEPELESFATDVNDRDVIVGKLDVVACGAIHKHAFVYDGVLVDLDPDGCFDSRALAVSDSGLVVGQRQDLASLWTESGGAWSAETLDLADESFASDVGDDGLVVGRAEGVAVVWRRTEEGWSRVWRSDQPESVALGRNASAAFVGGRRVGGEPRAWHWRPGLLPDTWEGRDLNALVEPPEGWVMTEAVAINDAGWVAGRGFHDTDGDGRQGPDEPDQAIVLQPLEKGDSCD